LKFESKLNSLYSMHRMAEHELKQSKFEKERAIGDLEHFKELSKSLRKEYNS